MIGSRSSEEDSGATPSVVPGPSAAAQTEHGEDATTPVSHVPAENSQFQMAMMQQSQLFQVELFKKLFDNKDS